MIQQAMLGAFYQLIQFGLVLAGAPLLTGLVRTVKARLAGRCGPSILQPYRDLRRLLRKDIVLAENASWLFRVTPYLVFAATWLAASLVPTFTAHLALASAADLIALIALLATARFFLALAGLDVGTGFGGIGSSRAVTVAALAAPALLLAIFSVAILARTTSLPAIAGFMLSGGAGPRISLALALVSLVMVAVAETGRMSMDDPGGHSEPAMIHEAMVLEYSGRHLALIEAAGMLRLLFHVALVACIFVPWGMALPGDGPVAPLVGLAAFAAKLCAGGLGLALAETLTAKMRVFRHGEFLGIALLLGLLGAIFLYVPGGT